MIPLLLAPPAQLAWARRLATELGAELGRFELHRFPDGEALVTLDEDLGGRAVALVASLQQPDALALPLRFAAATAREFGARSVGLVAPYLAYMRQDHRFAPGQALSARLFAGFLQDSFDWLVTVDPHLHRHASLAELYRIPTCCVASAPALAEWIRAEVPEPLLIGPDSESSQWVADIAGRAGAPHQILAKQRSGDCQVEVSVPDPGLLRGRTPVIVDDIVASGHTMARTLQQLAALGARPATCIVIHAVGADAAFERLQAAGAGRIVSTDSILHPSNAIGLAGLVAQGCRTLPGWPAPAARPC